MKNETGKEIEKHIGKVVHFDESGFNVSKRAFESYIIPALTQVQKTFEKLHIGKFSNEIFKTIWQKGIREIKKYYDETISDELSKMKQLPAVSSSIAEYIAENSQFDSVQKAWQRVEEIKAGQSSVIANTKLDYSFLTFDEMKSEWILDIEALKRSYQKTIEDDTEAEAYEMLLQFQKSHCALRQAITKLSNKGIPILPDSNFSDNCLLHEDNEGNAHINLSCFAYSLLR